MMFPDSSWWIYFEHFVFIDFGLTKIAKAVTEKSTYGHKKR